VGPMAGGLIIRDWSWAWIFWMNVPIGLASIALFVSFLHEEQRHQRPSIDIPGAILFTVAIAALMIALTEAGTSNYSDALIACAVFVVGTFLFVAQERRAADPMISFSIWSRRPIASANGIALLSGMALMGLTTFLPMYVQGVLQRSPVVAGLALTVMMVGWPVGATMAARSLHRFALRSILIAGSAFVPAGAIMFYLLTPTSSPLAAALGSLVMGFGMGVSSVACLILIQEIVTAAQRGSVTASNIFSRNLGSTLGATVFGAVLNYGLGHAPGVGVMTADQLRQVLDSASTSPSDTVVRFALQHSLHLTFSTLLVTSLLVVVLALLIPHVSIQGTHEVLATEAL
jgi:MFS family permease